MRSAFIKILTMGFALLFAMTLSVAQAVAASCVNIANLDQALYENSPGATKTSSHVVTLETGDALVFGYSIGGSASISIDLIAAPTGVTLASIIANATGTGTVTFNSSTADGNYTFRYSLTVDPNFEGGTLSSFSATCTANPTPTPTPTPEPEPDLPTEIASLTGPIDIARLNNSPVNLPNKSNSPVPPASSDVGDGEPLAYLSNQNNDPVNDAFMAISAVGNGFVMQAGSSGPAVDVWTRLKVALIAGTRNRAGAAVHGELGVVHSFTDDFDAGVFLSVFRGGISDTSTNASLNMLAAGGGGYVKFEFFENLQTGLSASYEISTNDFVFGTDTGTFRRDRFEIDYSLSGEFVVEEVRIVPIVNLGWVHLERYAYTDSANTAVPAASADELAATLAITVDRTFEIEDSNIASVTPSVGVALNYYLLRLSDLTFLTGPSILQSPVDASVNAGMTLQFHGGASASLNLGIEGIANNAQAYSAVFKFTAPIN